MNGLLLLGSTSKTECNFCTTEKSLDSFRGKAQQKTEESPPPTLSFSHSEKTLLLAYSQLLKSAKLKRKRNLPTRCSKSKNGNSLVGKIAPNDTEAIPRHNIEAFVRACIAPSLSSFFSIHEMNQVKIFQIQLNIIILTIMHTCWTKSRKMLTRSLHKCPIAYIVSTLVSFSNTFQQAADDFDLQSKTEATPSPL
ncbi:hypothetical protein Tsp_01746 [Trichinella spiralis]|uniref:hypothetical protein n=1 Tax=Trichinella spiralis TaxID=6334 RepID=UPI0001EFCA83|nr:hypothetical protein Tsp_01746 [Trichinella spiralis]